MKTCADCGDQKLLDLFSKSAASKDGKHRICKACDKLRGAARYAANSARKKESAKAWAAANPEKRKEIKAEYKARNRERLNAIERERQRLKRIADPEKFRRKCAEFKAKHPEKVKASVANWRKKNIPHRNAYSATRQAEKIKATPAWANRFFIGEAYDLADRRKEMTGIDWHVDHIVPLRSKVVCGLHVETNLRVIPALHNMQKHNKFEVV
jgi:hypothetical protein